MGRQLLRRDGSQVEYIIAEMEEIMGVWDLLC